MPEYDLTIAIIGKDQASGVFGEIGRSLKNITETALGVAFSRMLVKAGEDLLYLAGQAVNATAQIQMMELSLQALAARELVKVSGGVKTLTDVWAEAGIVAGKTMDELSRISILSPYTVAAVQNTFRLNTAFGFTFEQAQKMTHGLLNMAAGVGADNEQLKRMAYNLSQIRLQGKVTAMDIRQLALAGLDLQDVLKFVSKEMGYNIKSHLDFNALIKQGKIDWTEFAEKFSLYADKYFGTAAERMARTLLGLKSTFSDVFVLTMPQLVGPAIEEVTDVLNDLLNIFLAFRDTGILEDWGNAFGEAVKKWLGPVRRVINIFSGWFNWWIRIDKLAKDFKAGKAIDDMSIASLKFEGMAGLMHAFKRAMADAFGEDIVPKIERIQGAFEHFKLGEWFAGLADLGVPTSILDFIKDVKTGLGNLQEFWNKYGPDITRIFNEISTAIWNFIVPGAESKISAFGTGFAGFTQSLIDNGPTIIATLDTFSNNLKTVYLPALDDFFKKVKDEWIPKLGDFAKKFVEDWLPKLTLFFDKLANEWIPDAVRFGETIAKNWPFIAGVIGTVVFAFVVFKGAVMAISGVLTVISAVGASIAVLVAAGFSLAAAAAIVGTSIAVIGVVALVAVAAFAALVAVVVLVVMYWDQIVAVVTNVANAIKGFLLPIWTAFTNYLQQYTIPFIMAVWNVISALGELLYRVFVVILLSAWDGIKQFGALVADIFGPVLQPSVDALKAFWEFLSASFLPIWEDIVGFWEGSLKPAFEDLSAFLSGTLLKAWEGIKKAIKEIIDFLNELAELIRNIDLGKFDPGSPTPFEMGLRGINKQLIRMNGLMPKNTFAQNFSTAASNYGSDNRMQSSPLSGMTTYYFAPVTVQAAADRDVYSMLSEWRG